MSKYKVVVSASAGPENRGKQEIDLVDDCGCNALIDKDLDDMFYEVACEITGFDFRVYPATEDDDEEEQPE